ncbi:formate/nitrite transporter family protein [Lentisalinibacter sediminis]|uniref:formate/nitrite transporter family protein n=1 Tax=Lentisalinibacter sediminis TaxID=2992237 RepID=UPI003867C36C
MNEKTEKKEAEERQRLRSPLIYEIVRREGIEELRRPTSSLWWSGLAAGVGISASLLGTGLLFHYLPAADWAPAVSSFGYCLGFLIVVLGRLQLFTEQTVTAVLPLLKNPKRENWIGLGRLWGVVLIANLTGTFLTAVFIVAAGPVHPEHLEAMLEVSRKFAQMAPGEAIGLGIPAGFLVAAMVWMIPNAKGSEFWVVIAMTYLIALGGFAHVIVGSSEVFLLQLSGELGIVEGLFGLILPSLLGNIIGGTGLFALLAYGQVQEEF